MLAIKDNYHIFRIRFYLFSLKQTSALPTMIFFLTFFFQFYEFSEKENFCHL